MIFAFLICYGLFVVYVVFQVRRKPRALTKKQMQTLHQLDAKKFPNQKVNPKKPNWRPKL